MAANPAGVAPRPPPPMASQAPGIKMNGPPGAHHGVYPHAGPRGAMPSPPVPPRALSQPASSHASPTLSSVPAPPGSHQPSPVAGATHRSPPMASGRLVTPDQGDAHATMDLQGTDDYSQLSRRIKETNPQVVRQVLRDNWQSCFLGSDFHNAFIVSWGYWRVERSCLGNAMPMIHFLPSLKSWQANDFTS